VARNYLAITSIGVAVPLQIFKETRIRMRRFLLVCMVVLAISERAAAQGPLDLFPEDAAVGVAIRDLDDLIKKGDDFLVLSEIRMPIRPSQLFDQGTAFLRINKGLNRRAPAAVILMSPEKEEDFGNLRFLNYLVPVLPFTDPDAMAENFGIAKGKLVPKAILRTERKDNDFLTMHAARTQNHIYLNDSEKTLQRILKSKPIAASLSPAQRKLFDQSDVLIHFGRYLWELRHNPIGPDIVANIKLGDDPAEKEFVEQFAKGLREVQNALVGFRVHEGIDAHFLATTSKDGQAAKLFKSLRGKGGRSTLSGLPEGNVLLAQASSGDAAHQALLVKAFFNFMLEDLLMNQKIVHHVDRLTYLGVFQEVWRRLQGNRLAVYQNLDERKLGLFSAVAILDTQDAKLFLRDMRILSKMASADSLDLTKKEVKEEFDIERIVRDLGSSVYVVRQSANTKLALIGEPALAPLAKALESNAFDLEGKRRARELRDRISAVAAERRKELLSEKREPLFIRPKLTFVANVEKRQGLDIDVIRIQIAGLEKAAPHQYSQLLGPDWDKVRLAVVGNQIVVMLGSDLALFEAALRNIQKGEAGLAGTKRLAAFHELAARKRQFELHVSVEGILRLVTPMAKLDTPAQMTSVSLTLGEDALQVDARVPTPEVRAIARRAQQGMR
jgi:hypothetical protein